MTRVFKLMTLGALGTWLLASTGCEDKVCKQDLAACKKEAGDIRNECTSKLKEMGDLKARLSEAQAKVDTLTKENDEMKAKAAETKTKSKATKGKKKRKGKR